MGRRVVKKMSIQRHRQRTPAIAAIFILSGFAALIYQVAWQRALFSIYGLDVQSVTVVVTAFMLGLGVGSLAGGWAAARPRVDRLVAFALIEAGICAYGMASLALFAWAGALTGPVGPAAMFLATFALLLLPTALMGATLPLLVGHEVERRGNVGRSLATLYFANTLGGALAAIATGVLLMRSLGLQGTVLVAAAMNAAVAALAVVEGRLAGRTEGREDEEPESP